MTRDDRRGLEAQYVAQTQAMAQEAGRKELKAA
jgi:hypothetical protein